MRPIGSFRDRAYLLKDIGSAELATTFETLQSVEQRANSLREVADALEA
jgi:MarR family transcriptional regulator for hemolysin